MPPLRIKFNQGNNTAADRSELGDGEMQRSTGGFYRPGDDELTTIGGRQVFGDTGTGAKVKGIATLLYDEGGTDQLVALSGTVLYGATLNPSNKGATGTFSSVKTGLDSRATSLSAAHYNDWWFLGNGYDRNWVIEADGTVFPHGMFPPVEAPSVVTSDAGATVVRAASDDSVFTNPGLAYDGDVTTYASHTFTSPGTIQSTFAWSGTANTASDRTLNIRWAVAGGQILPAFPSDGDFDDVGGSIDAGFRVNVKFEYSEDGGNTFTEVMNRVGISRPKNESRLQIPITDGTDIDGNLRVRVTYAYTSGITGATLRLYDLIVNEGAEIAAFDMKTGVYYAITEFDATRGLESKAINSPLVPFSVAANIATLTLPSSTQNSNTTHWRIYRTTDGGSIPSSLGLLDEIESSNTTYVDDFSRFGPTATTIFPLYPLLRVSIQSDSSDQSPQFFAINSPPPSLVRLRAFRGSLVGISRDYPRALYYSAAGRPHSWPEINVVDSFPLEEHDTLLDCVGLGGILVIAANGAIMRMSDLPRVVSSVRDASRVEQIKGAPGCVGRYALTTYSVSGQPFAAYISHHGLYITDGDTIFRISKNVNWNQFQGFDKSGWVLQWDANRLCLVMAYSSVSGGDNDRYYLFHMAPEHRNGDQPKWTGPHYGRYNHLASAQLSGFYRLYSAHATDGKVYLEDFGQADASNAYDANGTNPLDVISRRIYANDRDWAVLDAELYHSDFGSSEECTLDWTSGRDFSGRQQTRTQAVSLERHGGTHFDIARSGQWAEVRLRYTGTGRGSIRDLSAQVRGLSKSGTVKVA